MLRLRLNRFFHKDLNFIDKVKSNTPIDVVIVAIDKDFDVLVHVIDSIRKNIKHPIDEIIIISPESVAIKKICREKKCKFVDENTVLPITKKDIKYTASGNDRSGWLFQQLLKWSGDKFAKNEYFLIADADTVFCRPQIFVNNKKVMLPVCSQLCHIPYYYAYNKLTGESALPLLNFTSHHSLFQKSKLHKLKQKIKKHTKQEWYKAIISTTKINPNEGSCVSDYETYAQYLYSKYPDECRLEHWFNLSLCRKKLPQIKKLIKQYQAKYKAISFHTYKK